MKSIKDIPPRMLQAVLLALCETFPDSGIILSIIQGEDGVTSTNMSPEKAIEAINQALAAQMQLVADLKNTETKH